MSFAAQLEAATENLSLATATHEQRKHEHHAAMVALGAHKNHAASAASDAIRLQRELATVIANGGDEVARAALRSQVSDAHTVAGYHVEEARTLEPTIAPLLERVESSGKALLNAQTAYDHAEFFAAEQAYVDALPLISVAAARLRRAAKRSGKSMAHHHCTALIDTDRPMVFGKLIEGLPTAEENVPITILPR